MKASSKGSGRSPVIQGNLVYMANVRSKLRSQLKNLIVGAGIHLHTGNDRSLALRKMEWVVDVVVHAANLHGLEEHPDVKVLVGAAYLIGESQRDERCYEEHREAIMAGLVAAQSLFEQLHSWALVAGVLEKDQRSAASVAAT